MDSKYDENYQFDYDQNNFSIEKLTFIGILIILGFISMIDPPRLQVKAAVNECYGAGVKVFMVTGDHPITAHAIAKSLNLITGPT